MKSTIYLLGVFLFAALEINTSGQTVVPLTLNADPRAASISVPSENDLYSFQTLSRTGGTYIIQTYGRLLDTYMYLYRLSGTTPIVLGEDDDSGAGNNALISRSNLSALSTYYVRIRAYSSGATGNYSINVIYEGTNPPPRDLQGTSAPNTLSLSWTAPITVTPSSYKIYKSSSESGPYLLRAVASLNSITFTETPGTYWYYVTAVYASGESVSSNKVNITIPTISVVTLTVDATATSASLNTTGERDLYRFLTSSAGTYTIQTHGSTDMLMDLYTNNKAELIESDDDDGDGNNSLISRSLSANTWYYVEVRGYGGATGSYSIDVKTAIPQEVTLIVDAPATNASISAANENDWYKFQTSAAGTYTMQTYGSTDMYMYLYQSDKTTLIEEDDDDGEGYNPLIARSLSAYTWYYVKVKGYNSSVTGSYSIDVKTQYQKK